MSRESAKAKYTRLSGDPEVGYISPDDVMDAIDIMYDDLVSSPVVDASVAADADIDRSKIAGTALTTSSTGVFSVLDYGADPTGVADSTTHIQAAIDAAVATGGTVFFPPGTFKITAGLTVAGRVTLQGAGMRESKIQSSNVNWTMIESSVGLHVVDLWLDGARPDVTVGGAGLHLNGASPGAVTDAVVERCRFTNIRGTALAVENSDRVWVRDCVFDTVNLSGVRLNGDNTHTWIQSNQFLDCQAAAVAGNAAIQTHADATITQLWVESNYIEDVDQVGVGLDCFDSADQFVLNNRIIDAGGEGIAFSSGDITIQGNTLSDCTAGILYWCVSSAQERITILGNTVTDSTQGVALVWGDDSAITDVLVAGNLLTGNTYGVQSYRNGADTTYAYDNVTICNNVVTDNGTAMTFVTASDGSKVRAFGNVETASGTAVQDRSAPVIGASYEGQVNKFTPDVADAAASYWIDNAAWKGLGAGNYNRVLGSWWGYDTFTPGQRGVGITASGFGGYANAVRGALQCSYGNRTAEDFFRWQMGPGGEKYLSFFGADVVAQPTANADTSGATLGQLETEVNELKAALRSLGLIAT